MMNGKIYYNAPAVADSSQHGYYCVDMYTGQQLWYKNGTENGLNNPYTIAGPGGGGGGPPTTQSYASLTQGQLYHYSSVNGAGILSYLIIVQGSTWYYLDAATGNLIFTLKNVPGGTAVTDQDGSLLRYSYNAAAGNILCWNSSQSIRPAGPTGSNQQQWKPPQGGVIDAVNDTTWTVIGPSGPSETELWTANDILPHSGYTMNVTSASLKGLPGTITAILQDEYHVPKQIFGSNIVITSGTAVSVLGAPCDADTFSVWLVSIDDHATAYSPFPNATGTQNNNLGFGATLLINKNIAVPLPGLNYTYSITAADYNSQTFQLVCKQTGQSWCYSLKSGDKLWGPTTSFNQMDYYGLSESVYYGKLIQISQYGGTMAAYDITNGNLLWVYNATATSPYESAYGNNMPLSLGAIVDGTALL
jgi:outer membrane protein assembly factor BamB